MSDWFIVEEFEPIVVDRVDIVEMSDLFIVEEFEPIVVESVDSANCVKK